MKDRTSEYKHLIEHLEKTGTIAILSTDTGYFTTPELFVSKNSTLVTLVKEWAQHMLNSTVEFDELAKSMAERREHGQ